ncbi:TonB-dependent receptor plug domain-containing protein [Sulfitobacter sabulilitoris]|uniref:TonB-dependent receptor n=1 Tax=Sulfitobacter sabulilitoris TaxID=2562655 RepID=A0A5S3PIB7_9RHOB|nr:TonB-dependent receptor [Sulfitobacter sabulilitoris]TMM54103.1 TonB-dependent receptor [Sulfitobacter sabulilitoris]
MKHLLTTASLMALVALPATAQDNFDLGEITVFANETPRATDRTGATVEIVTEDEVQASGTVQVVDVLTRLPGITVAGNGGVGAASNISLRGLPARYVPVYINGIDVTDPSGPQTQFSFGGLLTSGIGRIEVLKGSQSALYGSEAIGGVVNITTLRPTRPGTELRLGAEYGSYNTRSASLAVLTRTDRADLAFTFARYVTDGFSAADENDGNTEDDGFSGTQATLTADIRATDRLTLGLVLSHLDTETDQDGFPPPNFVIADSDDREFAKRSTARLSLAHDGDRIDHSFALNYSKITREYPVGFTNRFEGERREAEYKGVTRIRNVDLAFGLSYTEEEFAADTVTGEYDIAAVFIESQYMLGANTDLTLTRRYDDHSEFGGFQSNRAAIVHRLSGNTRLRASIGNGFRAPSLYELFGPFGDPTLEPEESRSAEVGVAHDYANGAGVKATLFYTEIENLIDFGTTTYTQIPGTSRTRGVELTGEVPLNDRIMAFGGYTYTRAEDRNGNQLLRVPEHNVVLGVDAQWTDQWSTQLALNHIAGRADEGFPAMPQADYTVVNATIGYAITDQTDAYLRIENLFDEEYQTSAGYGTSDRAVYFGVRASF